MIKNIKNGLLGFVCFQLQVYPMTYYYPEIDK